jgi:glutamate decarboxylase
MFPKAAFQVITGELILDGSARQNLATFCQTWAEPELLGLMELSFNKNMMDKDEYPQTAEIERRCVHMLADLWHAPDDLVFHVNYLGGDMPDFQINFSRPAGQIIAQYYNFLRLGRDGYRRIHQASYDTGQYIAQEIIKLGPFELLCDSRPAAGIPTVTWRIKDGQDPGYTLFDLADRLRARGWQVPAYTLTGTASGIAVQRVLVRLGVSRDMASLLLDDFAAAVAHFGRHPVMVPQTEEESGSFNHL